jgi:transposase-like protein
MIHKEELRCLYCSSNDLVKNGKSPNGTQRWRCNGCKKCFQFDYRYNVYKPGVREKIIEMTLNSSGVRDIGRVLRISKDTVCSVLKKNAKNEPLLLDKSRSRSDEVIRN